MEFSWINFKEISYIFEFGWWYWALATIIYRLWFEWWYFIYDFELFNQLQRYFFESEKLKITDNINENWIYCYSKLDDLSIKNVEWKKVFIATWSISETPLSIRYNYLQVLDNVTNDFNYFILWFQDNFWEVDNNKFFSEFKNKYQNIKWYVETIPYLPKHNLFFWVKIKE
jgi:hypothetical protein